jgi:capsular polysaccharide biosynthesis protein
VQEETTREVELGRVLGTEVEHAATVAHEFGDAILAGGSMFAGGTRLTLLPGGLGEVVRHPPVQVLDQAALDCTFVGNRYFGHWLMDDCTLHLLAREHAPAIGLGRAAYPHEPDYRRLLGLHSGRVTSARVRRLLVFEDHAQHAHKRARYQHLRAQLSEHAGPGSGRGIFLRRGCSGVRRLLVNEEEIETRLTRRGFAVLDPAAATAAELAATCAGAPCVVSVEGSGLAHGVLTAADKGALLTLQPPFRFNNVFKDYTDCLGMRYGFVVGARAGQDFSVAPDEVERTLDLLGTA